MDNKYKPIPFWSWNDELEIDRLIEQIDWMHESGIGGFFMHARGGLTTPYLGKKWFECVESCLKRAKELDMEAYAYDENGWPSGFAGGELLKNEEDRDCYLTHKIGPYDENAFASYDISGSKLIRVYEGDNVLNVYCHSSISTADICNKETVRKFIELTHKQYKKHDIYGNLRGFFTDEPQYYRWGSSYTHALEDYFRQTYDVDIKDYLGLLFYDLEDYRDFRYKYWKAMQHLMLNNFAKQVYEYCDANNYKLTGHYVEESSLRMQMGCCGGIMPYYEYEHIPGIDWLGRRIANDMMPRQVGSVAAQLGKKQVLTESFALVGWDATPEELKHMFEWQAYSGVSLLCHHLLPYSEHGQRKRDYPEHYSDINPWAKDKFNLFNEEITKIGEKISTSTEYVNVGVLHPIRSAYFDYKREDWVKTMYTLENDIYLLVNELSELHIPFHFLDETLLAKYGSIDNKELKLGLCKYDVIILPLIYTMDKTTESLLKEYVTSGGKILLMGDKPNYLEGKPYDYYYLNSNITMEDVLNSLPFKSSENKDIRISLRKDDNTKENFFYIVNLGEETSFVLNDKKLHFKKWESRFINELDLKDDIDNKNEIITLNKHFKVKHPVDNYLTLDTLYFSKDGINYSENYHHMAAFKELLKERYQGELYLKYKFNVKSIPETCSSLIEDQHIIDVFINNNKVNKKGSILEKDLFEYDIVNYLKEGENEIIVKINFVQNDDVYFALFGENVTESLRNCLAYPTTIEAIYLKGIFGVFGDFKKGNQDDTYLGENFYLDKQKEEIDSLILDGFPFFRGKIDLSQELYVEGKPLLYIPERFSYLDLFINDEHVEKIMFKHEIDISKYIKQGENKIDLSLIVSNRNLLGPFHQNDEEPILVTPESFERRNSWDKNKSKDYRENYSFVKTII